MKKVPIVSTVRTTIDAIKYAVGKIENIGIVELSNYASVVSFFKYEMPEIKIIDFGDENIDGNACLKIVQEDPWLLFGGVIAITNTNSEKMKLEQQKEPNFLFVCTRRDFEKNAVQIIKILHQQQHFLFNRGMQQQHDAQEHGQFVSDTDPFEIVFYANLIGTYLYNTDRISDEERSGLQSAMMELLLNAVEHGNCDISYEEKNAWLKAGKNMLALIAEKQKNPEIASKKIYITYSISLEKTKIKIRDEGRGFDWKSKLDADFQAGLHGMGIKLAQGFVKNMTYNTIGNEVSFEVINQKNIANLTPAILKSQQVLAFKHMQIVCRENEDSNNLFYISSGRYAVYVDNKLMSVLTPADIFIGEMAFLMNDRRSATVVSIGEGTLVKIPKMNFMNLIESYPHYGVFLSRLLAGRLARQSKVTAKLKEEKEKV
ncbi:cyclic nucleotide-binding domain-containing protein [Treponema pedis]|uniref:cyclic nucleotide-binding domain-containing protein n=1 Tax=Treponema pedis TaxID=409322 RepID=UPI0003F559B3|nr:cyclic nucleotide-binding domain-containing protein [Treponema pedis]